MRLAVVLQVEYDQPKEDKRIGIVTRTVASLLQDGCCFCLSGTSHISRSVNVCWEEDHKPGILLIRDFAA